VGDTCWEQTPLHAHGKHLENSIASFTAYQLTWQARPEGATTAKAGTAGAGAGHVSLTQEEVTKEGSVEEDLESKGVRC
jgi:hypothetical protein